VYKNHNSPICCDIRLSKDFAIKPVAPPSVKYQAATPLNRSIKKASPGGRKSDYFGSIGWNVSGMAKPIPKVLHEQPHKDAYNHGQLRCNFQMETTGQFADFID